MSSGTSLPWRRAYRLAERVDELLEGHVARSKAVGSLRRRRSHVSDIEFVVEPFMVDSDLFGKKAPDTDLVRHALEGVGTWEKNGERYMQLQNLFGEGVTLDLFLVHPPAQWGSIVAIRTGPAELGQLAVTRMRERGYRHRKGRVVRLEDRKVMETETEPQFFELAGIPYVGPTERDKLYAQLRAEAVHG